MSVYLSLRTSGGPSVGDVMELAHVAEALGVDPKRGLTPQREHGTSIEIVVDIQPLLDRLDPSAAGFLQPERR